nr:MAG TPA: hypothetical protein [Caudoviricetes sp.]
MSAIVLAISFNYLAYNKIYFNTHKIDTLLRKRGHFLLAQSRGRLDVLHTVTTHCVGIYGSYRVKNLPITEGVRKAYTVGVGKVESGLHAASGLHGHIKQALPVLYFHFHYSTVMMLSSVILTF